VLIIELGIDGLIIIYLGFKYIGMRNRYNIPIYKNIVGRIRDYIFYYIYRNKHRVNKSRWVNRDLFGMYIKIVNNGNE
jgi:hypothetical protein